MTGAIIYFKEAVKGNENGILKNLLKRALTLNLYMLRT